MMKLLRIFWRGYSDADMASVERKASLWHVAGSITRLNNRECRALRAWHRARCKAGTA